MQCVAIRRGLQALALWLAGSGVHAADYWSYQYKDFAVITAGSSEHARTLAQNIARFDNALTHILQVPARHLPTRIYELQAAEEKQLLGEKDVVAYRFSGYEVTVVSNSSADPSNPYWGALFGYTGSLLVNGRTSRCPYWFQVGVPQLFAHTEFKSDHVETAGVAPGFAQTLQNGKWIPMRTLLRLQGSDPQITDHEFQGLFEAESWYLAREIYVEGKLRAQFAHYLGLLQEGNKEGDAFAASFSTSYEDLDKLLITAMKEPTHKFVVATPREPADSTSPQRLTPAEVKAHLAELSIVWRHRADALKLAAEALQSDPKNERALRVTALANAQNDNYGAALAAIDALAALPTLSGAALTDMGEVLSQLSNAVFKKEASLGLDAAGLARRAQDSYERAISLDGEYLRAWAGLAYLYGEQRDVEDAKGLASRADPVMDKHLYNGALARALATMCSRTGQAEGAFRYGEVWRDDAITQADLDQAVAFISRIKAHPPGGT